MAIYSLIITKQQSKECISKHFYLNSFKFYQRWAIEDLILASTLELSPHIKDYEFHVLKHTFKDIEVRIFAEIYNDKLYVACADANYPIHIGKQFMSKCKSAPDSQIRDLLKQYQDYTEHDTLDKIEKELKETEQILSETLKNLIERNENLEDLVMKSESLSSTTKLFFKAAKKRNKCC